MADDDPPEQFEEKFEDAGDNVRETAAGDNVKETKTVTVIRHILNQEQLAILTSNGIYGDLHENMSNANKNLAIANRSRVSCAHYTSRASP